MKKIEDWLKPEKLALLAGWRRNGLEENEIARKIGIRLRQLEKWKEESPEIYEALKIGREAANYLIEERIFNMSLEGNLKAIELWLKNKMPAEWGGNNTGVSQNEKSEGEKEGGSDFAKLADMINNPSQRRMSGDFFEGN